MSAPPSPRLPSRRPPRHPTLPRSCRSQSRSGFALHKLSKLPRAKSEQSCGGQIGRIGSCAGASPLCCAALSGPVTNPPPLFDDRAMSAGTDGRWWFAAVRLGRLETGLPAVAYGVVVEPVDDGAARARHGKQAGVVAGVLNVEGHTVAGLHAPKRRELRDEVRAIAEVVGVFLLARDLIELAMRATTAVVRHLDVAGAAAGRLARTDRRRACAAATGCARAARTCRAGGTARRATRLVMPRGGIAATTSEQPEKGYRQPEVSGPLHGANLTRIRGALARFASRRALA